MKLNLNSVFKREHARIQNILRRLEGLIQTDIVLS